MHLPPGARHPNFLGGLLKLGPVYPIFKLSGNMLEPNLSDVEFAVDYAMTPGGLLVHSNEDWPCAVCRPSQITETRSYCICLNCAYTIMAAASAGEQNARAMLDEISDALCILEAQQLESRLPAN